MQTVIASGAANATGGYPQGVDDGSLEVVAIARVPALSGVAASVVHVYDDGMSTTPTTPQVCDLSRASLGELTSLFDAVGARIGELVQSGAHRDLDGASQVALVRALNRAAGVAEAAQATVGLASHRSGELRQEGFFSVKGLLADGVGVSSAQGSRVSKLGTGMERYPLIRLGVLAGRINPDAARAACEGITSATSDLRGSARDEARTLGEAIMVGVCETATTTEVEKTAAALVFRLDPESAARRALEALEKRHVKFGTIGETAVVSMVLDAWTAAQLVTLLETKVDEWFRTGSLPEHLQPSGDDDEDQRRRTVERPRLLAEAFAELIEEMLGLAGTRGGSPVNVTFLGSADIHADGGPAEILIPGRESVPVPAETLERALCEAEVTEIHVHRLVPDRSSLGQIARSDRRVREAAQWVHPGDLLGHDHDHHGADHHDADHHDDGSQGSDHADAPAGHRDPHDLTGQCAHVHCVARRHRFATRGQRAALAVRDRHCRFPGCRVDQSRCRAHHVRTWSQGGATCLSNLVLLCQRHHALVHELRWTIHPDDTLDPGHPDRWRFLPPKHGYVGRDGAHLAERLRRGQPPEPPGPPPPVDPGRHAAA